MNAAELRAQRLRNDSLRILDDPARKRIDRQRDGFKRLGDAISRAGFHKVATEFRLEAGRAIQRAEEFEAECLSFEADKASLEKIRAVLDATDAPSGLSDAERVDWIVAQWKSVSRELATSENATEKAEAAG
jgi:hypothetical protein